jgi:hypothetical protein
MYIIRKEEDKLDQDLEDSHSEYEKMKLVLEKKIDLYKRLLKKRYSDRYRKAHLI